MHSVMSIHMQEAVYMLKDRVVASFFFLCYSSAVWLKPGDVLSFNPLEPHVILSRYHQSHDIFCLTSYLKSSVVGLNDNDLHFHPNDSIPAIAFCKIIHRPFIMLFKDVIQLSSTVHLIVWGGCLDNDASYLD